MESPGTHERHFGRIALIGLVLFSLVLGLNYFLDPPPRFAKVPISRWAVLLQAADQSTALNAADAVLKLGPEGLEWLLKRVPPRSPRAGWLGAVSTYIRSLGFWGQKVGPFDVASSCAILGPDAAFSTEWLESWLGTRGPFLSLEVERALVAIGPAALEKIRDNFERQDEITRTRVFLVLGHFTSSPGPAFDQLIRAGLKDPSPGVRYGCLRVIVRMGKNAAGFADLVRGVDASSERIRLLAAEVLHNADQMSSEETVRQVRSSLNSTNRQARVQALRVLRSCGAAAKAATDEVRPLLQQDTLLAEEASLTLAAIGGNYRAEYRRIFTNCVQEGSLPSLEFICLAGSDGDFVIPYLISELKVEKNPNLSVVAPALACVVTRYEDRFGQTVAEAFYESCRQAGTGEISWSTLWELGDLLQQWPNSKAVFQETLDRAKRQAGPLLKLSIAAALIHADLTDELAVSTLLSGLSSPNWRLQEITLENINFFRVEDLEIMKAVKLLEHHPRARCRSMASIILSRAQSSRRSGRADGNR